MKMKLILFTVTLVMAWTGITCSAFSVCNYSDVDIVFLLDHSNLVGKLDFLKELNFVKNVVQTYTIGPNATQVGLVTFSDIAKLEFPLNAYTSKTALLGAVTSTEYGTNIFGTINVEAALNYIYTSGFNIINGGRASAVNLLVLLTSRIYNNASEIREISQKLRVSGVAMYVVGTSSSLSYNDLNVITSETGHAFRLNSFDGLQTFLPLITDNVCTVIKQHKTEMKTTTTNPKTSETKTVITQHKIEIEMELTTTNPTFFQSLTTHKSETTTPKLAPPKSSVLPTGGSPSSKSKTGLKVENGNETEIPADDYERPRWLFYAEIVTLSFVTTILIGECICVGRYVWISLKKKSHTKWKKEKFILHNRRRNV